MKSNKLISLCVFVLLVFHSSSFAMFPRLFHTFRGASKRLRSRVVDSFLKDSFDQSIARLEEYAEIVESPIKPSQEVMYSEQEYLSMAHGFNSSEGVLRKSSCPFIASLCNSSNDVHDDLIIQAIDDLKESESEIFNEMGYDLIYDYFYDCELRIPFDLLYHAVRMNKSLAVIKKLVLECGCDVNYNVIRHAPGYQVERLRKIVLCPTALFWACLHENYDVARFLIEQGAKTKLVSAHGKIPMEMAKDATDFVCWKVEKEIQV